MREVDILVETHIGPYKVKLAVEAKDEKRPMDLPEFESLLAKYRGEGRVQVDKFVVVTRAGYTKGATERAQVADVELFTLTEAIDTEWKFIRPKTITINFPPHLCGIEIVPALPADRRAELEARCHVYGNDGICYGTLHGWVFQIIGRMLIGLPTALFELMTFAERSPKGEGRMNLSPDLNQDFFLQLGDERFQIERLTISIHAVTAKAGVTCKAMQFAKADGASPKEYVYFESHAVGKKFQFITSNESTPQIQQSNVAPN